MWPDRVSNPGPLTYESGALPTSLRAPISVHSLILSSHLFFSFAMPHRGGVVGWCDGPG